MNTANYSYSEITATVNTANYSYKEQLLLKQITAIVINEWKKITATVNTANYSYSEQ